VGALGLVETVLVVDDERTYLNALARSFVNQRKRAITASSGEAAFQIAANENPQLAIIDLYMPGLDGIEVIRGLRNLNRETFLILMSAATIPPALTMKAIRAGANDCIVKGPDAKRLLRVVEHGDHIEAEVDFTSTLTLEAVEHSAISRALVVARGNRTHAARFLGITRQALQKRLRKQLGSCQS